MEKLTLRQVADMVEGTIAGDESFEVSGLSALNEYEPGTLTFAVETSPIKVSKHVESKNISALIVSTQLDASRLPSQCHYIQVKNPRGALPKLIGLFFPRNSYEAGIHETAVIHPSAQLGAEVHIGPYCVVGAQCSIGDRSVLHAHVTLYDDVQIGSDCLIHSGAHVREQCVIGDGAVIQNGAVIGSDGFGYTPDEKGNLHPIPQVGKAILGDRVDVGANSCIDRAALGTTTLGSQSKLDNLVQVGHNVKLGRCVILCGSVAIGGSVTVGDGSVLGGKSAVADHLTLAPGVRLAGKTGVVSNISEPGDYAGYPHRPARDWRKEQVFLRKLNRWQKQLRNLLSKNKDA